MWKRLFFAASTLAALAMPLPAAANTDWTDIWFESVANGGWGANLIQAQDVIFITFFIYGSNNTPTWVVATMQQDASGNFSGNLYSTVGTYYGAPWNPANYAPTLVGTASFFPIDPYTGTLTYVIKGVTVTKSIQRQTLKTTGLGGVYTGGETGTYSGNMCTLGPYEDQYDLTVTQPGDGSVKMVFSYLSNLTCTFSGTLVQQGQLYAIPHASYVCSDGLSTTANMDEVKATAQGIEGTYFAQSAGGGCSEQASFSAVFNPNVSAAKAAVGHTRTSR